MKIVVLDGYALNPGDLSWQGFEELGEVTVYDRTSYTDKQEIIERIGDAEAILTNKTPITADVLKACPQLTPLGSWQLDTMSLIWQQRRNRESP